MARRERDIQADTLIALQEAWPFGLFYRRNVGAFKAGNRFVKFGVAGQADIAGCVEGRMVEIEVKAAGKKQRLEQKHWQEAIERCGGIYILASSPEQAIEELRRKL